MKLILAFALLGCTALAGCNTPSEQVGTTSCPDRSALAQQYMKDDAGRPLRCGPQTQP